MTQNAYCLFETAIGVCGIAWRDADAGSAAPYIVTGFQLPEATRQATRTRIGRFAHASAATSPPPEIAAVIARVVRHLARDWQDFGDVPVDLAGTETFAQQVYAAARAIPPGETRTYGALARSLGQPGASQAVGQALGRNPIPLIVPCHRIVAADGKGGGFSAHGGLTTKARLLAIEGAMTGLLDL